MTSFLTPEQTKLIQDITKRYEYSHPEPYITEYQVEELLSIIEKLVKVNEKCVEQRDIAIYSNSSSYEVRKSYIDGFNLELQKIMRGESDT